MVAAPALAVIAGTRQIDDALQAAVEAGLRYVSDTEPGFTRVRAGGGFEYRDQRGERVDHEATRAAAPPLHRP